MRAVPGAHPDCYGTVVTTDYCPVVTFGKGDHSNGSTSGPVTRPRLKKIINARYS
jgi:hypothetical protein